MISPPRLRTKKTYGHASWAPNQEIDTAEM